MTRNCLSLMLVSLSLLICLSACAVISAAVPVFPSPVFDASSTPVLQWTHSFNSSFSTVRAADGKGLFVATGSVVGRMRAVNGATTWSKDVALQMTGVRAKLGDNAACTSPFTPMDDSNHLYVICSPNILVKMWYDTGVVEWSVAVAPNAIPLPSLNRIVGLSNAYDPPALLVTSAAASAADANSTTTASATLFLVDSRNGTLLAKFGGNVVPTFTPSPTAVPATAAHSNRSFTRFNYLHAFLVAPLTDSSIITVVAWMQLGPAMIVNESDSTLTSPQQELIVFRLLVSPGNLTINDGGSDGGNYQTMLTPPIPSIFNQPQSYYASHSLNSQRLYIRVAGESDGEPNFFMVTHLLIWTAYVNHLSFPLTTFLIDSTDGGCRYIMPSQLVSNARVGGALLLPVLDTLFPSGPPSITFNLDFSDMFPEAEEAQKPFYLIFDPSVTMQLIVLGATRMVTVLLDLNPPLGPQVPSLSLVWSFIMYERWSNMGGDGQPMGNMKIESWSSKTDFSRLVSISLLPDMQSQSQMLLVHTNSTAQTPINGGDGGFKETLWVFTTRSNAPTCNDTAAFNCTLCESASGHVTARQCAYCPSTHNCLQIGVIGYESCIDDPSFALEGRVCIVPPSPSSPELLSTVGLVLLLLAIGASLVIALIILVRRSRAKTKALQGDESLRETYYALSPEGIAAVTG